MELAAILVFMPTWFLVSISPGMCMTLALSLGIAVGLRRTLWMMAGEILGACAVAALCVLGLAQLLLRWPLAFSSIKWLGGAYLLYLGVQLWRSRGNLA
ncbi:MAG: LysE family transporter, partial [Cellvibrionaceae bacterium]|nr:LysE family transporter [Cellvibrionaceae bacterium]